MAAGTLFTIGMGPGDPELMTLKAVRIIGAAPGTTVMHQNVAIAEAIVLSCFRQLILSGGAACASMQTSHATGQFRKGG